MMKSFILAVKSCSWRSLRRAEFTKDGWYRFLYMWSMSCMFRTTHFLGKLWTKSHGNPSKPTSKKIATEDKKPLSNLRKSVWNLVQSYDSQNQKAASANFLKLRGRMWNSLEHKISPLTLYKNAEKKPCIVQASKFTSGF